MRLVAGLDVDHVELAHHLLPGGPTGREEVVEHAASPPALGQQTARCQGADVDDSDRTIKVTVTPTELDESGELPEPREYAFPRRTRLRVVRGQVVEPGDQLNEGSLNPAELLLLKGATQGAET